MSVAPVPSPQSTPSIRFLQHPEWRQFDWLDYGFSTRAGGRSTVYSRVGAGELNLGFAAADDYELVQQNRDLLFDALTRGRYPRPARLTTLSQVHSATVHRVNEAGEVAPGDGLVTATPGVYLAILTADCVPVLMVDSRRRVVAAIHAGWRGTVKGIVQRGVARMQADFASDAADISALIGPAIGACCYVVGEEVRDEFAAAFSFAGDSFSSNEAGSEVRLDLVDANWRQLIQAGVPSERIYRVGGCTSCEPETYFSHRQSRGHTGRMMSVIGIRES